MTVCRATIRGFSGSWGSGLGYLLTSKGDIPCDNAPTVRALEACFGECIGRGHTAPCDGAVGQDIAYGMDDMGLVLGWFTPYDEWLSNGRPEIEEDGEIEVEE